MKFIFTISFLSITLLVSAQKPVEIWAGAGATWSRYSLRVGASEGSDTYFIPGYSFNGELVWPLSDHIALQSGLSLLRKGSKIYYRSFSPDVEMTAFSKPLYASVPVRLLVYVHPREAQRFFVGIGGYAAMSVGGRWSETDNRNGVAAGMNFPIRFTDAPMNYSFPESYGGSYLKRGDFGISLTGGWEYKRYKIGVGIESGIRNIGRPGTNPSNFSNQSYQFTLGYRFR